MRKILPKEAWTRKSQEMKAQNVKVYMHSFLFPCVISKGRVSHLHTVWVTPTARMAACSCL